MPDKQDAIEVVFAVYDPKGTYSRHAGVAMLSVFEHTKGKVCVHILHDETLTEDNRARFQKTADAWGQEVRFDDVSAHILNMGSPEKIDKLAGDFSRGALFRLLVPQLITSPKVIYLDCDIVVNMDIAELWNIDMGDCSLAAKPDRDTRFPPAPPRNLHGRIRAWAMRCDSRKYFNSGVLVMNLDRIRQRCDLVKEAKRISSRYRFCIDLGDQDLLNILLCDDVFCLSERFNSFGDDAGDAILHFAGDKPWLFPTFRPREYLYWETLARSEWRDRMIDAVFEICRNGNYVHRHSKDCFRRLLTQWRKNIWSHNNLLRDPAAFLMELCYRMKDFCASLTAKGTGKE